MPDDTDDAFADLPPSAKLVAKVIEHEGEMDASEVSEAARLHPSTTRDALKRLAEEGVVDVSVVSDGSRRLVYSMDTSRKP
jgi:DNA-binding MarR family transcriptional regulator